MKYARKLTKTLLTLALLLTLPLLLSGRADAAEITDGSTSWTEDMTLSSGEVTISSAVTASDGIKLTISTGAKLTVSDTITVGSGTGTLTVGGTGTLVVVGAPGAPGVEGNLTVESGTVTVTGGRGSSNAAGVGVGGDLTVSGGTVTVYGGDSFSYTTGVGVGGGLTVSGGTVTVCGGRDYDAITAAALGPDAALVVTGGSVTLKNGTRMPAAQIPSIAAGAVLTINGGVTVADGMTLTVEGPGELVVEGAKYCNGVDGDLTVESGTVTVTGGTCSSYYGGGVGVNGALAVNGGTVTVKGGTGAAGSPGGVGVEGSATVNGGTVTLIGRNGGNTSGGNGVNGVLTVSGGTVTVTAGDGTDTFGNGGIGVNGKLEVGGGTVDVTGGSCNYSRGGDGVSGDVDVSGGTVTLAGGASSFGGGGGNSVAGSGAVTISGGSLTVSGGVGIADGVTVQYGTTALPAAKAALNSGKTLRVAGTWDALYDALREDSYVLLTDDVTCGQGGGTNESAVLEVPSGKTVTLDLNGKVVNRALASAAANGYVVRVLGSLTLEDSVPNATHRSSGATPLYTYTNAASETVEIKGGVLTGGKNSGSGGGVRVEGGTFTMNGGAIFGNFAHSSGGGVSAYCDSGFAVSGKFYLRGGMIVGNTTDDSGGGVEAGGQNSGCIGVFEMTGGTIADNEAHRNTAGGGVYIHFGDFTMSGGAITNNRATNNLSGGYAACGGGVYLKSGTFKMEDGATIKGNKADDDGGGVYANSVNISITIEGGTITENAAGGSGGGVWVNGTSATLEMTGGAIKNNIASGDGGGVWVGTSAFTMSGGAEITGNSVTGRNGDGGGVYVNSGGTFNMNGGTVSGNSVTGANGQGGGVYLYKLNDTHKGTFNVSGTPVVTGNHKGTDPTAAGYDNNVYLPSGIAINVTGDLTAGASLGVTLGNGYTGDFLDTAGGTVTGTVAGDAANGEYFCELSFDGNGGTGTMATLYLRKNAATPLPACTFTRAGYNFALWKDANGAEYADKASITLTDAATLTAQWTALPTPAPAPVSYDDGGSDDDTPSSTTTTTNPDGSVTRTTTNADGSKTAVTTMKDGSTSTVKTDKNGNIVSVEAVPSAAAIEAARQTGAPIRIPVTVPVVSAASAASAPTVTITLPDGFGAERVADMPRIEIGVTEGGSGVVAMEKGVDGAFTPIRECYEGSVIFPAAHSCEVIIVDNSVRFDDVSDGDWYAGCVTFVTARGIFNGTGGGMFSPNAAMTRAMLTQALYNFDRGAGPKASTFADAAGKWYADAAGWAASVGVVTGTDRGFEGEASVTREQAAAMLYRYAKLCGYHVDASADLSTFSDAEGVSDWAREAMSWAVAVGIINGTVDQDGNIILDAQGTATRAQVAAIVQRFCENVAK